ncbi:MAG: thioredoxin family protein [Anaerorhabdus sp.]
MKTNIEKKIIIKVLGSGCKKCMTLENNVKDALLELELPCNIEHITELSDIVAYGVMSTPALVINDEVVSTNTILSKKDIIKLIKVYF